MAAMASPAPAVVVAPSATMASNLDDITVCICDHRLLLGDGHRRCGQGRSKRKSAGGKSDQQKPFHLSVSSLNSRYRDKGRNFWELSEFHLDADGSAN